MSPSRPKLIPGYFGHDALWLGDEADLRALGIWDHPAVQPHQRAVQEQRRVLEALRSGVQLNTLANFMNVDDLAVLRDPQLTERRLREILIRGFRQVGKHYDFNFDVDTTDRIACAELIYLVYADVDWRADRTLGRFTLSPDRVAELTSNPDQLEVVLLYLSGRPVVDDPRGALLERLRKGGPGARSGEPATLAEPLSCVVNSLRVARLEPGDTVLVYGAGPMGLLNLALARFYGAARVLVVDVKDARLAKAAEMGADAVLNSSRGSVREWVAGQTAGQGVNVAVTAVPVRAVQQEAVGLLAPFGRLCLFAGLPKNEGTAELDTNAIHYKNLYVTGMTGGAPRDYRTALRLIQSGRLDLRPIVSHRFPLADLGRAYDIALGGQGLKVVLADPRWLNNARS